MKKSLRQSILDRDGYRCQSCGSADNLHIHHYVTQEEGKLHGAGKELIDHPHNLITLCWDCHSLTYVGIPRWLFIEGERDELRKIGMIRQHYSLVRQQLKEKHHNLWDTAAYQDKKRNIDRKMEELRKREIQIRAVAKNRVAKRRKDVLEKLLDRVTGM